MSPQDAPPLPPARSSSQSHKVRYTSLSVQLWGTGTSRPVHRHHGRSKKVTLPSFDTSGIMVYPSGRV